MSTEYNHLLIKPGEGEHVNDVVVKIRSGQIGGAFSVMQATVAAHQLLTPHTHTREDQAVYIIEGELEFEVGGEGGTRFTATKGAYVAKPRNVQHCFWNVTDHPCHYIELSGEVGFENFVDATGENTMKAALSSKRDFGLTFHQERIPGLLRRHGLTSIAGLGMPQEGAPPPPKR